MEDDWSDSSYNPQRLPRATWRPQLADLDRPNRWIDTDPDVVGIGNDRQVIHTAATPRPRKARHRIRSPNTVYLDEAYQSDDRTNVVNWRRPRDSAPTDSHSVRTRRLSLEEEYQTACNPDQPVNLHVRLQLPITLDLDEELGELARLRRVGDFRAAKMFFSGSTLAEHMGHPYVFVQYADLLLAMEDYKALKSLQPPPGFGASIEEDGIRRARREQGLNTDNCFSWWRDSDPWDEESFLLWNWRLIRALVLIHVEDCVSAASRALRRVFSYLHFGDALGSTEVQIIVLCFKLYFSVLKSPAHQIGLDLLRTKLLEWVNWQSLFQSLSRQNRHWDCCDLKAVDAIAFGYRQEWNWQRNFPGSDRFDFDFTGPWEQLGQDESSLLACLDQTTSIALALFTAKPHAIPHTKRSSDMVSLMDSAAELLKCHYPAAMRSRPFVRWLILSSQAAGEKSGDINSLEQRKSWWGIFHNLTLSPGFLLMGARVGISLPIYVPRGCESPKWETLEHPPLVSQALHLALNLARDMDDYPTQVICYKLLALRSKEPRPLLESLCRLQEAHGDRVGYLKTLLSSYIGLDDVRAEKRLLDRLTDFRDAPTVDAYNRADIEVHWAHDVIKRALRHRIDGRHNQDMLGWLHADYVLLLPKNAADFADEIRAERDSLMQHTPGQHRRSFAPRPYSPPPAPMDDTSLERNTSSRLQIERHRRETHVANGGASSGETLSEKKERWSRQLARLRATKEQEMFGAATPKKENDNPSSSDRQSPRSITSPDDSADEGPDDDAAKERQVILWKGDYRNHEQWLALNRAELDPAEYYRKWAAGRNPDAAPETWGLERRLGRERERRNEEGEPRSDEAGDELSSIDWTSHDNRPDERAGPDEWDHRWKNDQDSRPRNNPESNDHTDAPKIPHVSVAQDSPAITRGEFTAEPAEMVVAAERAPSPSKRPTPPRHGEPRQALKHQPGNPTAGSGIQRRSAPSNVSGTRSRSARVDSGSDLDELPTVRRSQDHYPYVFSPHTLPGSLPNNPRRHSSYLEQDAVSNVTDPTHKRQYASSRAVRWEDHERRRQNDRIGNRAPSVAASEGPPRTAFVDSSASPIASSSRQCNGEPGRPWPIVISLPGPKPRRGRPSVTIADPPVGSGAAVDRRPSPPGIQLEVWGDKVNIIEERR
ncbi:uncharacterized protein PpBr36_10736 [Pyricularia pennisetigena]|uniref:uncharacterized protein n=1 Tax=Pyricularia pennisetigena TaxID=1578925 RepID=UPI00115201D5|nr:uncharacterized protein PpBr36_10736 [Pyricularia pennisetigena]TLS20928.1 hypothetical protein PpBr36_10736 [Pyricularia pennisetigena]